MTDTGNFAFNSNNPDIYEMIAELVRIGIDKDAIYNAVFNQYSADRVRLMGYALYKKMQLFPEFHLALITLSDKELQQFNYKIGDTEGLVNMPLQISDVYYSVFMREQPPKPGTLHPVIKLSFRSGYGERLAHDELQRLKSEILIDITLVDSNLPCSGSYVHSCYRRLSPACSVVSFHILCHFLYLHPDQISSASGFCAACLCSGPA